jgi:hypothetical protein
VAEPVRLNPFPGLRPFRPDEEHLFFGREHQIDRMVDKLARQRFLAVVGTSGSGKSSLVNCGLRPALHRGYMAAAGAAWRIATLRPGSQPIAALAHALAAPGVLFDASPAEDALSLEQLVEGTLRLGSLGLVDIVEQARLAPGENLLVVADQFEELFRYQALMQPGAGASQGPSEDAIAFVRLLIEAAAQRELPIYVVLTMRSDFLGDCAQFHGLPEAINDGQYLVPRLARDEIRAAITGPVHVAGAQMSPLLLTRLLNDVGDNPDQLSILQHALNRTWAGWEAVSGGAGEITLAHYEAIGGMSGALDQHAEKAYAELNGPRQQRICERLFKTLTDKGTDARGIRRPTKFAALCEVCGADAAQVTAVIELFRKPSRSFVMPPSGEPLLPHTVIDISHESLMRVWSRLVRWADEEAESAGIYQRLTNNAALHGQHKAALLPQVDLDQALQWRAAHQPNVAWARLYGGDFVQAMDYLDASQAQSAAAQAALGAQRRVRTVSVGVALAVMLAFTGVFIATLRSEDLSRWADAHALLKDVAFAAKAHEARAKGDWPDRDADCKERFVQVDTDTAPHLPTLNHLCDPQAAGAEPPVADIDGFLAVIALLNQGDLVQVSRRLESLEDYDTRRAAESMVSSVLDLQTQDLEHERRDLADRAEKATRDRALGAAPTDALAPEHPVHRAIHAKLNQGEALSAGESALIASYKSRKFRLPAVNAAVPEATAASAPAQDSKEQPYAPMINAASRAESVFAEVRNGLEPFVSAFLVLLIWPMWKGWRWWRRRQGQPIRPVPSALRVALAHLFDVFVAVASAALVGLLTFSILEIADNFYLVGYETVAFIAGLLALLAVVAYTLFRDAIRLRYCRSLGKIVFNLRLVHAADAAASTPRGFISLRTSARRNWTLLVLTGLAIVVSEAASLALDEVAPDLAQSWNTDLSITIGFVVGLWLPALVVRRRGWHHHATRTVLIDADSDESQRVDAPPRYLRVAEPPAAAAT